MTRVGWCPGGRTVAEMLAMYPGTTAVRIFYGPGDGLPAGDWTNPRKQVAQAPQGAVVIVSHKDQAVDAAAFVDAWQVARPDLLLVLVAHHEPEQQEGGDPTPEQFRASWARQRVQVANHPARAEGRLALAVCYTLQWIRGGGDWRRWWPENAADTVDLVLCDWYQYEPGAPNPFRPRSYEDPASALAKMLEIAKATGKPWGIAEIDHLRITKANGFAVDLDPTGDMCAAWYRRMFAAAKDAGCVLWCHFHRGHGDLASRLPEQQALRDLIEQEAAMAWSKGQQWRVVRSLDRLNEQIRAAYPRAVPPATPASSWGAIADSAHSSTSDHYPHFYTALGKTAVVCARDFPHAPTLGLDAHALADQLRQSRDPRISYVISNGRITGPSHGWQWDPYNGSDPHDTHIHVSTVHTAAADDTRDWQIGEDDSMDRTEFIEHFKAAMNDPTVAALMKARPWQYPVTEKASALNVLFAQQLPQLAAAVKGLGEAVARESSNPDEIRALLAELPKPEPVDVDQVAGAVAERVLAALPDSAPVSRDDLEAALRSALGSLDGATPTS